MYKLCMYALQICFFLNFEIIWVNHKLQLMDGGKYFITFSNPQEHDVEMKQEPTRPQILIWDVATKF